MARQAIGRQAVEVCFFAGCVASKVLRGLFVLGSLGRQHSELSQKGHVKEERLGMCAVGTISSMPQLLCT